jgi:cobyrinic acid a,c-diamide synthase
MKMKVELILENPMAGGCGCSVSMSDRMALMKRVREQAKVWEKVKKGHRGHEFTRSVMADQGPEHVVAALETGSQMPLVFVDSELVHSGSYPTVEVFEDLLSGGEQNT